MLNEIKIFLILFLFGFLVSATAFSQDKSNRGKEFWLGYGYNSWFFVADGGPPPIPANSQELNLYITTEAAATVTVSIPNTGWSQTLNVPANTVNTSILIPKTGANDARIVSEGLSDRAIHILSDTPIVVFAHMYNSQTSGATMLIPVETYGYKYYSLNYTQSQSNSKVPYSYSNTTANGANYWYSWFYVVASEDNTRLEITPSDTTQSGVLPSQTFTVNLNKGQIYNVMGKMVNGNQLWQASKDLTGSKVVSVPGNDGNCHPFALFSGSGGIRFCYMDGGEVMMQQAFPVQSWGTRYLTYHLMNNTNTNIHDPFKNFYRITVNDPATIVNRNGVPMTGLIRNFYYEIIDSTGGDYITSDKPIMVAQYMPGGNRCWNSNPTPYGDPEMIYLSPLEQGSKDVLFYANRKTNIDYNYLNVLVQTTGIPSLRIDGAPFDPANIITHPNNPAYSVAVTRIMGPAAQHRLTCDSVFNGTIYGLGYVESYGYNVGTFVNNLNSYIQIQNTFNTNGQTDTFTCPKTPFRLYIKLAYQANTIHWKLSQVPGLSPNADSIISNPIPVRTEIINGRTYYVYTLQQDFTFASVGTFQIPISYTTSVIENCNQTEYALLTIKVKPGPTGDFTFTTPVCLSDSVYFNGSAGANGYTLTNFLWNFPDNTTANIINPVKKFTTAGANSVRFRVIASNGCLADTTKQVNINDSPVPRLGATSPICQRDSVYITDTSSISSGSITSWRYDFGDGSPALTRATNTPFWHQYLNPGNYTIKLVLNSSLNCKSDTGYKTITVLPKPLAKFGYDRTICAGDSIRFSDSSSTTLGSIVSWKWIFGDGNTEIRTNNAPFYHPYSTPGPYAVSLLVTTGSGCVSDTFKLTVNVVNRPVASISTNIGLPCVDSLRNFASSFTVSGPATWYWNFGDGQTFSSTTSNTAAHAYSAAAANIIVKHVVDLGGGCVSDTATITIPVINPNPVASFGISGNGNSYCKNENISFTSALTGIATWNWNFGNGTGTNTPPFTRSYNTAGPYTLSLQVKDANGCGSLPVTKPITILDIPVAKFGYSGNICVSDSIRLTDTSSTTAGTITQWEWIFGDGNSQIRTNGNPFYHQYTTTGNFTVSLVTVSSNGCKSDTAKRVVSVSSKPSTTFTSFGIPCVDSVRQFTSSFITGAAPATWYWNFGDGQTASSASGNSISHSYSLPRNNVIVKHVVDLGGGCVSDTAIITIPVIHPNPAASFTIIGDTLCTNKPVLFTSGLTGINVWNWQLGDGPSGQQPPFSHIYKTPGTFNISLTVKDINGCGSNQATDQLVINASPAINAGPDKYISTNSSTTLDATIANAGNYSFVWTPGLYLSSTTILNPVCTPDYDPMTYTITAIDNTTFCTGKDYVIITPVSKIYIPTGFTPNNDGKNDKWVIPGLALYPDAVVSIYNRWGEKIFESKNYINNPWTGFYKTLLQPAGAYVYTIQLNDDKKQFYKGTVTLIW